jgi:NAD-dependent SIR2 family protein deacetylase
MPKMTRDQGGKLVIVNMQNTPLDSKANIRVYARCDDFMSRVMNHLRKKFRGNFANCYQNCRYLNGD